MIGISEREYYNIFRIRELVEEEFEILEEKLDFMTRTPVFIIRSEPKHHSLKVAFLSLNEKLVALKIMPVLRDPNDLEKKLIVHDILQEEISEFFTLQLLPIKPKSKTNRNKWLIPALFIATCASVTFVAIYQIFTDPLYGGFNPYFPGIPFPLLVVFYALSILGILGLHELGHLLVIRSHGIKASLPYFIPIPFPPLGTLGAVIKQESPPKNRDELFDLGIAGPLVGFLVTIIVVLFGLALTRSINTLDYINFISSLTGSSQQAVAQGLAGSYTPQMLLIIILEPLFFLSEMTASSSTYFGVVLPDVFLFMHPLAFAGWIGLLLSSFNMMMIGQLDGGHVARAVFGNKSFRIPGTDYYFEYYKIPAIICLIFLLFVNFIFAILVLALSGFKITHPGPQDDVTQLSILRKLAFLGFIGMIVLSIPLGSLFWLFF